MKRNKYSETFDCFKAFILTENEEKVKITTILKQECLRETFSFQSYFVLRWAFQRKNASLKWLDNRKLQLIKIWSIFVFNSTQIISKANPVRKFSVSCILNEALMKCLTTYIWEFSISCPYALWTMATLCLTSCYNLSFTEIFHFEWFQKFTKIISAH